MSQPPCGHDQRLYSRRINGIDRCNACQVIKAQATRKARMDKVGFTPAEREHMVALVAGARKREAARTARADRMAQHVSTVVQQQIR